MNRRQYLLMILDGVGISENGKHDAFKIAKTPNIDRIFQNYPTNKLEASGVAVGLPEGQMGNSEVGHVNIGAGRVVYQGITRITKSIEDGDFFKNEALVSVLNKAKETNSSVHFIGLLSDGGVHSHQNHLYALMKLASSIGVSNAYIHAILDGRDTAPKSAEGYIDSLEKKINELQYGKIATISGRYYAMDRDSNWDRIELAYDAMASGIGDKYDSAIEALKDSYNKSIFDEFVKPCVVASDGNIEDGDSVIFFNFRPDRARELSKALVSKAFDGFDRKKVLSDIAFVTMTEYDSSLTEAIIAYRPQILSNTLGEFLSKKGYSQLRIAETEKYAHVTFFLNGGKEEPCENESREMIASPKDVATYDLKPEMSAYELTDKVIEAIKSKNYDVIILNYANGDMVGHTGNLDATVKAVESLDECVGRVIGLIEETDGEAIITADHGNCECMKDEKGTPMTAHTISKVPICIVSKRIKSVSEGSLCDIAPTLLYLMGEEAPEGMTGKNLAS